MSLPSNIAAILRDHVNLVLESIDRMYHTVVVPQLQYERGISAFLHVHRWHKFGSVAARVDSEK